MATMLHWAELVKEFLNSACLIRGVGCVRTRGIPRIDWAAVYQQGDNRNLGGKGVQDGKQR